MSELMANDSANVTVVHGVIHLLVEKRRLQNTGRKIDVVHLRVVVGIDGGRGNLPFSAIDRLANFVQLPVKLKRDRSLHVPERVIPPNGNRAVVAPPVW